GNIETPLATLTGTERRTMICVAMMVIRSGVGEFNFLHRMILRNIRARNCGEHQNDERHYVCKKFHCYR
ncbi:MAG TPA: hypothetical protein VK205_07125, partial [Prolixibacteraceae bacterium]|nr:hypothetical protein [Prolixibacteraceae bacterium]